MLEQVTLDAYAKLNLSLDITGRRGDGYHLLDTVMQSVGLCDVLSVRRASDASVTLRCDRADVPVDESNTAIRAARAFFAASGRTGHGVEIFLQKRIPSQAGMGGGSADAAAVLRGLNLLYEEPFRLDELRQIGLRVGADVPFCVEGGTARARGIGELLEAVPPLPDCHVVICKPAVGVDTRAAYRQVDCVKDAGAQDTPQLVHALETGNLVQIARSLGNTFQRVLHIPEVEELHRKICSLGALNACMTGSGSAVFGIFSSLANAERCAFLLQQDYSEAFVCAPVPEGVKITLSVD